MKKFDPAFDYLVYETTQKCNLDCVFCYNIHKIPDKKAEVINESFGKSKKILKTAIKNFGVRHITMSGGEPFCSERFIELVLWCRMQKCSVTIITNGTAANPDMYKQAFNLGVNLFELPIHSHIPANHDKNCNHTGAWHKSLDSIKYLLSLGAAVVPVIVLTKHNIFDIHDTLLFIQSLGLKQIMINRYNIGGRSIADPTAILPELEDLRKAFSITNEFAYKNNLKISSNVCTPICVLNPDDYKSIRFGSCADSISNMPITVDNNGNLRLCNHSPVVFGNILTDTPNKLANSEYIAAWNKSPPEFCLNCGLWNKCKSGCMAASEQYYQSTELPDPILSYYNIQKLAD